VHPIGLSDEGCCLSRRGLQRALEDASRSCASPLLDRYDGGGASSPRHTGAPGGSSLEEGPPLPVDDRRCSAANFSVSAPVCARPPCMGSVRILCMAAEQGPSVLFLHVKQGPPYPTHFSAASHMLLDLRSTRAHAGCCRRAQPMAPACVLFGEQWWRRPSNDRMHLVLFGVQYRTFG
jgi:hypothetical protein